MESKNCPQCGIDWDGNYCSNCRYGTESASSQKQRKSKMKKRTPKKPNFKCVEYTSLFDAVIGGIKAYFTGLIPISIIILITNIICFSIVYVVLLVLNPEFLNISDRIIIDPTDQNMLENGLLITAVLVSISSISFSLWYFIFNHFQSAAILCFVDNKYQGVELGILGLIGCFGSLLQAVYYFFFLLIPRFLAFLIFNSCLTLFVLPGLYVLPCLAFVDSWALFRGPNSIKGSFSLVKGRWWSIFGCTFIFKIIPSIIIMLLISLFVFVWPLVMLKFMWIPLAVHVIVIFSILTLIWHMSTVVFYHIFRFLEKDLL